MTENITIDKMIPGEEAVVNTTDESDLSGRLRDLGLTCGTPVKCLHRAPLGDPTAYEIRGAVIALRREDSRKVYARRGGFSNG